MCRCSAAALKTADVQKPIMDQCSGLFVVRLERGLWDAALWTMTDFIPAIRLIRLTALQWQERSPRARPNAPSAPRRLRFDPTLRAAWREGFDALASVGSTARGLDVHIMTAACGQVWQTSDHICMWCGVCPESGCENAASRSQETRREMLKQHQLLTTRHFPISTLVTLS